MFIEQQLAQLLAMPVGSLPQPEKFGSAVPRSSEGEL